MSTVIKTQINYLESVKNVLEKEAKAILKYSEILSTDIIHPIELLLNCKSHVIVTGIGKSGIVGKKISATLASTGTPSYYLHPAEGLHGDLGMVKENDVVLAISNSGESEEVIQLIPSIKKIGAKLIALVGNEYSTLAKKADGIISIGRVEEACPLGLTPTTSTTLILAIGDAIAITLLKAKNFTSENFAVYHPGGSLGKKLLISVGDVIQHNNRNPKAKIYSDCKEVLFEMTKSRIGAVSVVDGDDILIGILTDGDLRRALTAGIDMFDCTIEQLYNQTPITISSELLAVEALKIMENKKINVLPVIDEKQRPIAMIHITDITKIGL
ncbi:KpsF/GutQ family sugar-phosphate isomerase [Heyndrickxia oleronia]|uniref:KpsF/GutQ family sugar-phosphate isomerase n=1 Tax=Heyndrickxia oleronia TaxID=38875 RepID=UPI001C0EF7D9|nr:KpsF/GutQ family sugar-phosphate isomerase [Heyndrickxia oleronia]MBU5210413.1 KpsF/GutQ family sugar-phosphate isomerase [Heyndrickxia oleronia]